MCVLCLVWCKIHCVVLDCCLLWVICEPLRYSCPHFLEEEEGEEEEEEEESQQG